LLALWRTLLHLVLLTELRAERGPSSVPVRSTCLDHRVMGQGEKCQRILLMCGPLQSAVFYPSYGRWLICRSSSGVSNLAIESWVLSCSSSPPIRSLTLVWFFSPQLLHVSLSLAQKPCSKGRDASIQHFSSKLPNFSDHLDCF
jgi:hypothetical protein